MDHEVAIRTNAVERYLLGEMPSLERDAFEEHYFECTQCAEEIRSASLLIQDIKATLGDIKPAPGNSSPGWLSWLNPQVLVPTFAALVLAVVVGYQNTVVMPDLKAPRSMGAALILDGRTRGDLPTLRQGDPLLFKTAVENVAGGRLFVEVTEATGTAVRRGEVAAPPANGPLDVYFPGQLSAGRYQLVIRDNPGGRELGRSTFEILR